METSFDPNRLDLPGAKIEIALLMAEISRLRGELTVNAKMLAKQCDVARVAETQRNALLTACKALLVWAEWHKEHGAKTPRMNEPNTGAIEQARAAIAKQEDREQANR